MNILRSNNSAVGAGSGRYSHWPASGYRFDCGYPFDVRDVAFETRHGGIEVLGNKVNGFLKSTAPASVAEGPHAGGAGVGQMGYTTQLCRGVTESGAGLSGAVSKGAGLDSPGAVPQAGSHKNPRPRGRYPTAVDVDGGRRREERRGSNRRGSAKSADSRQGDCNDG